MTSSVIAMSFPKSLGVTANDRRHIKEKLAVPTGWQMWVGRCSGFSEVIYSNRVATLVERSQINQKEHEANLVVTTIALGRLLLHSISVPYPEFMTEPTSYGVRLGILPIYPAVATKLDWRWIPIIRNGSAEWTRLLEDYHSAVIISGMRPE